MAVNHRDFTVAGNLTNDPETVTTRSGDPMTVFNLAQNTRVRDEAGNWADGDTNFYSVGITNERLGGNVRASLRKGDRVNVEGTLQSSAFVRNNGEAGMNHRVFADDVSPSLRWHTAQPQPDNHSSARASAGTSAQGPAAAADQVVDTWATATPGSGGMTR